MWRAPFCFPPLDTTAPSSLCLKTGEQEAAAARGAGTDRARPGKGGGGPGRAGDPGLGTPGGNPSALKLHSDPHSPECLQLAERGRRPAPEGRGSAQGKENAGRPWGSRRNPGAPRFLPEAQGNPAQPPRADASSERPHPAWTRIPAGWARRAWKPATFVSCAPERSTVRRDVLLSGAEPPRLGLSKIIPREFSLLPLTPSLPQQHFSAASTPESYRGSVIPQAPVETSPVKT